MLSILHRVTLLLIQLEVSVQIIARAHFQSLLPLPTIDWYVPAPDNLFDAASASAWAALFLDQTPTKTLLASVVYSFYRGSVEPSKWGATELAIQSNAFANLHRYRILSYIPTSGDSPDCFGPPWIDAIAAEDRWRRCWLQPNVSDTSSTYTSMDTVIMVRAFPRCFQG